MMFRNPTWALLILLMAGISAAVAQECKPEDQVKFETEVDANKFAPLLSVEIPEVCGEFDTTQLLACQEDINVKEGCCMASCEELLKTVSTDCLLQMTEEICKMGFPDAIGLLDNLARRCDDDYQKLTCGDEVATPESGENVDLTEKSEAKTPVPESQEETTEETPAKECTDEDKVPFEEKVDVATFIPLLGLPVPESCGDFAVAQLAACQNDINFKEGCCDAACSAIFDQVSAECILQVGGTLCVTEGGLTALPLVKNLARRCDEDYQDLSCEELAELGLVPDIGAPGVEEGDDEALEELEEDSGPATFFGSTPSSATSDTATPDSGEGFFGSADEPAAPTPQEIREEEECPVPTVKDADVDLAVLVPFLEYKPENCGNFTTGDLVLCQSELSKQQGCCASQCQAILQQLPDGCVEEITEASCKFNPQAEMLLNRMMERCYEGFERPDCAKDESGNRPLTIGSTTLGVAMLIAMLLL